MAKILIENIGNNEAQIEIKGNSLDIAKLLLTAMHSEKTFATAILVSAEQYIQDTTPQPVKTNYHA